MTAPGSLSEQVLSRPGGAGSVSGLGETFAADPFTGTGRFSIPISLPPGHGGLGPSLTLTYSSGAGAGVCGVGWSFGVGSIRRRTEKGIPEFTDEDVFLLADDELVPTSGGYYRRRSEGTFERIRFVQNEGRSSFWAVTARDGSRSLYGRDPEAQDGDGRQVTAWHLCERRDANGNAVHYRHQRDREGHRAYLTSIEWGDGAYRVLLTYEGRPDTLRSGRTGVLQTTTRRLQRVEVQVRRLSSGAFSTFDQYELVYDLSPVTGLSRLREVRRTGIHSDGSTAAWPVLRLGYQEPEVRALARPVSGHPNSSLTEPGLSLVDLDGNGLPDLIQQTPYGVQVWRNEGSLQFRAPVPVRGPVQGLGQGGMFLSDMTGSGFADWVTPEGVYPNTGGQFAAFQRFRTRPSVSLQDPDARLLDMSGDGLGDVFVTASDQVRVYRNKVGVGFQPPSVRPRPSGLPRLSDRWTRAADMVGDGLPDLVRLSRGSVEIHQSLGHGRFAAPRQVYLPHPIPRSVEPEQLRLVDMTGTGAADLLVVMDGQVWLYANGSGERFAPPVILQTRAIGGQGHLATADLLGQGVQGLLYTSSEGRNGWLFFDLFEGQKPDVLASVDNGMGGRTTIRYGASTGHLVRDRASGMPWRFPLPFPVRVVDEVVSTDTTTGVEVSRRFSYHHGYYDGGEREFRGFGVVDQYDTARILDAEVYTPSRTRSYFDLGNGHRFVELYKAFPAELPADELPNAVGARRALRGMQVRQEVFADDGTARSGRPYAITHHAYRVQRVVGPAQPGRPGSFFAARTVTESVHTERGGVYQGRRMRTEMTYDAVGRVVEQREKGFGRRGSITRAHEEQQGQDLERYTKTVYLTRDVPEPDDYDAQYTPSYLLDAPHIVERWGVTDQEEVLLGRSVTYFDGEPFKGLGYPGTPEDVSVVRGRVSSRLERVHTTEMLNGWLPPGSGGPAALADRGHLLELESGDYYRHVERSEYDLRGMVIASMDPNGERSTVTYDESHGLFPTRVVDAAGHPTEVELGEFPHQLAAVTDANGNRTQYSYEPRGLPASMTAMGKESAPALGDWSGDPPSHPTESYSYEFDALPVCITTKTRQQRMGATFDVYRYLDGWGQDIQERHTAEADPDAPTTPRFRVTGWQIRNHKGLVVRTHQPTFAESADYAEGPQDTAFVATTYDPLGRPVRVAYPDGTFETTTYHPWVQELRDRNDNAGQISPSDPRYGAVISRLADHLDTPTLTFVDAFGRDIAVAEDAGEATTQTPASGTHTVRRPHVTRTVLDLNDQVVEVWDARELEEATWEFGYDLAGRRVVTRHTTALGVRFALSDAANNPIWSRDARGVEVNRTFDALHRPLAEHTDDGVAVKLRRAWRYIPYDAEDSDFADHQAANLFGQVEEARDADGLRYFEYDHRGLVTKVRHRFWGCDWRNGSSDFWQDGGSWDPAIPAAARSDIPTWLALQHLSDPTTIEVRTEYDAAGRPVQVDYPQGMRIRSTYNAAGLLHTVEADRGTGSGWEAVVSSCAYNARGQLAHQDFGNGASTDREYDPDIERLVRIFTEHSGQGLRLQDLRYSYDPVGNPLAIEDALTNPAYSANQPIPNTRGFHYDARYRLIRATGRKLKSVGRKDLNPYAPAPSEQDYEAYDYRYRYDEVGNFTKNHEYSGGQLHYKDGRRDLFNGDGKEAVDADPEAGSWRYDANGNATRTPRHQELAYTHDNQARYVDMGGGTEVRYFRHGDQRVLKFVRKNGVKALGVYLGPWEYHERTGVNARTRVVVHVEGHGRHAQGEVVLDGADSESLPWFFVHGDHLGSGHILTKSDGSLLSQEEYFPYGRASDRRDARNRYRFIGVEQDEETGLCITGPRTYDTVTGRFLQGDPLGHTGHSPYGYARCNPVVSIDASGYTDTPVAATPGEILPPPESIPSHTPSTWSRGDFETFLPTVRSVQQRASPERLKELRQAGYEAGNWRGVESGASAVYDKTGQLVWTGKLEHGPMIAERERSGAVDDSVGRGATLGGSVRKTSTVTLQQPSFDDDSAIPTPRLFVGVHSHPGAATPSPDDLNAFMRHPEQAQVEFVLDRRTQAAFNPDKKIRGYVMVRDASADQGNYAEVTEPSTMASGVARQMSTMPGNATLYRFVAKGDRFTRFEQIQR